ncbi:helix-turn-helix domain-containing protein [Paenibacillus eucommiae]|uniref:helix-turn-helix domain-containing protein n=1 Tax=Paenibacillus eucommiae TaxID=1355755 RepID=UPI0035E4288C
MVIPLINRYLILERIRKAKLYLLEADSVEKVAERLGYTSIHYFSRNFKEVTGFTPTRFKQHSIFFNIYWYLYHL